TMGQCTAPIALDLKHDLPEVEDAVRMSTDDYLVKRGDVRFQEHRVVQADSTLFNIFDFKLLEGDKHTALTQPLSVVLSQSTAKKYFGNADPLGQHLLLTGAALNATVTGIMQDIPEN